MHVGVFCAKYLADFVTAGILFKIYFISNNILLSKWKISEWFDCFYRDQVHMARIFDLLILMLMLMLMCYCFTTQSTGSKTILVRYIYIYSTCIIHVACGLRRQCIRDTNWRNIKRLHGVLLICRIQWLLTLFPLLFIPLKLRFLI